jgi:hypothetical protein
LAPPAGAEEESPAAQCEAEKLILGLAAFAIGHQMQPESGTVVGQGSPVTLSAESEWPLHFEVAATEEALRSKADIVSGTGTAEHGTTTTKYAFSSPKVTEEAGTVYWQVSFKRDLKHCNGGKGEERTFTSSEEFGGAPSGPHSLTVLSVGGRPEPNPPPSCTGSQQEGLTTTWSAPTPTPGCLRVGISAAKVLHLGHRWATLSYLVSCTARCGGQTSLRAWLLRPHKRAKSLAMLNSGSRTVSITASGGGYQPIAVQYRSRTLRALKRLLRRHGEAKLLLSVGVTDSARQTAQTSRLIWLRR